MYLITVARAEEDGAVGPVAVTAIAGALHVSVAAANEMVRKLAGRGFLEYRPYRGVELTAAGRRVAQRVLRTRRLWASFLASHLDFSPREADDLACSLEHVTPWDAAERLAAFLGDPESGPLGHPIPPGRGRAPARSTVSLVEVPVGSLAEVAAVTLGGGVGEFLTAEALGRGVRLTVAGSGDSGVLVEVAGRWVHLSRRIAGSIEVVVEGPDARG